MEPTKRANWPERRVKSRRSTRRNLRFHKERGILLREGNSYVTFLNIRECNFSLNCQVTVHRKGYEDKYYYKGLV